MRTIQTALDDILSKTGWLQFGLSNRLYNLSQLAKFLKPGIEASTHKEVTHSAVLMALSRLQQKITVGSKQGAKDIFTFQNIQVTPNLCIYSYTLTTENQREIVKLAQDLQSRGKYFSFTQGLRQITIFFSMADRDRVATKMRTKPINEHNSIAVVGSIFENSLSYTPGFFNTVFQQLYIHGINVVEVASTYTELLIYVHEKEMRLTFDVLYSRFMKQQDPS